ncbi:MAG: ATP-binding cassette domain-containing protein [Paenibacillaceae bacterium]|nr:ATP-binding cassette domain-containing protein [Paenibacillaceae bacterium]
MPLEGRSLGYGYEKRTRIIRQLDIRLNPGEMVGLIGPSGCGKSTLGKLLAGHLVPDQGEVLLDGCPLAKGRRNPVQLVLQHPEQAVNPRWKLRRTLAEAGAVDDNLLQALAVEREWLNRYPNELSGGELQRICVARALAPGTQYVIADEMTTMLDAITQAQIWQAVAGWAAARRAGILVISHDRRLVNRLCSRTIERGEPETVTIE